MSILSGEAVFGFAEAVTLVAGIAATVVIGREGLIADDDEADGCTEGADAEGAVDTLGAAVVEPVAALFAIGEELLNASVTMMAAPTMTTPPIQYERFDAVPAATFWVVM
jgi:hypothetical protein